jgi:hypothetical protein
MVNFDKITRWHPKFRLDEVPDIEPAEVPKPPNVQVYQTAKDVLENARGKVLPNVSMLTNIVNKFTIKHEKNRNRKFTHPFYRVLSKDHDKEIKIGNLALMCTKMYNLHIDITIRNQISKTSLAVWYTCTFGGFGTSAGSISGTSSNLNLGCHLVILSFGTFNGLSKLDKNS